MGQMTSFWENWPVRVRHVPLLFWEGEAKGLKKNSRSERKERKSDLVRYGKRMRQMGYQRNSRKNSRGGEGRWKNGV